MVKKNNGPLQNLNQKVQLLHEVSYVDHLQPQQQLACVYLYGCHDLRTVVMANLELKAAR